MAEAPLETLEMIEMFLAIARPGMHHPSEMERARTVLTRWATAWQGPMRKLEITRSNHGTFLHFSQRIGSVWCQVFTFHGSHKQGVMLRGPDPDRGRKSHKHRDNRLDPTLLDKLFEAWAAHPEAYPAGHAIEFFLAETPDETWNKCLEEALALLGR